MNEEFVNVYLRNLARRSRMYAHTNEAFVAIVETLLHTLRVDGPRIMYTLLREGSCGADTTTELNAQFARWVVDLARQRIDAAPRCTLCHRLAGDGGICSHGIHQCHDCKWDNGTRTKACWVHAEEPEQPPTEVNETLEDGIEDVIEAELTEVFKFKNMRLTAMFPGANKAKTTEELKLVVRAGVREACFNRYKGGVCKLCKGPAAPCIEKHARGEDCASPPRPT